VVNEGVDPTNLLPQVSGKLWELWSDPALRSALPPIVLKWLIGTNGPLVSGGVGGEQAVLAWGNHIRPASPLTSESRGRDFKAGVECAGVVEDEVCEHASRGQFC
jgi:hypothetical protein